jgi:WD40 repeat protein
MDVEDLGFSPGGGRYVATSAADRTAKLWDRETGEKIVEMPHNGAVLPLDFTHDGLKLMTGSVDKFARLWDLRTGQAIHEWQHEGEVGAVDISPDGRYGLSDAQDGTARFSILRPVTKCTAGHTKAPSTTYISRQTPNSR